MAVRISIDALIHAVRGAGSERTREEITRLRRWASSTVVYAAPGAPDEMHDQAVVQLVSYVYDRPAAWRFNAYANAMRNSGAGSTLLPWRIIRTGNVAMAGNWDSADADAEPAPAPVTPANGGGGGGGSAPTQFTNTRVYVGWAGPADVTVTIAQLNAANSALATDVLIPAYTDTGNSGTLFFAVPNEWGGPPQGVAIDGVRQGTNVYTAVAGVIDDAAIGTVQYKVYLFTGASAIASFSDGDRLLSLLGYPADIETNPTGADPEPDTPPANDTPTDTDVRYIGWVAQLELLVTDAQWAAAVRYENGGALTIPAIPCGPAYCTVRRGLPYPGRWATPSPVTRHHNGNVSITGLVFRQMRTERTVGGVIFDLWSSDNIYTASNADGTWTFTDGTMNWKQWIPAVLTRADTSYTDALILAALRQARGNNGTPVTTMATGALEAVAGAVGRAFAQAEVQGPAWATAALTPDVMMMVGRSMIRNGDNVYHLDTNADDGLTILPTQSHYVAGGPSPSSWRYSLHLPGPSLTQSFDAAGENLLHVRYAADPETPWRGHGPLQVARDAGRLSAEVLSALADESSTARGQFLPLPTVGDSTTQLEMDIKRARGAMLTTPTTADAWEGGGPSPAGDWTVQRFGANPPAGLVELLRQSRLEVYNACGISGALFDPTASAGARESWRQFLFGVIAPLGKIVQTELQRKIDPSLHLEWTELRAADVATRARAMQSMTGAGMELGRRCP